jgi:hypothetical protein
VIESDLCGFEHPNAKILMLHTTIISVFILLLMLGSQDFLCLTFKLSQPPLSVTLKYNPDNPIS